jgi:DNA invertase Pin-like site-specific DNA recombinase
MTGGRTGNRTGREIGCAPVSTEAADLAHQRERLEREAGVDAPYTDTKSGKEARERPGPHHLLKVVWTGDTVFATKLYRLGRSVPDLRSIAEELQRRDARLVILDQQIDTRTPEAMTVFTMLGAVAEFERSLIVKRSEAGQEGAKRESVELGRPREFGVQEVEESRRRLLRDPEAGPTGIASSLDIRTPTLYNRLGGAAGIAALREPQQAE